MVQMATQNSSCLLQELVLALAGHTGDVFVRKSEPSPQQDNAELRILEPWVKDVQIATNLTWLAPAERSA